VRIYEYYGVVGKYRITADKAYDLIALNECRRLEVGRVVVYYFRNGRVVIHG
jgi:hypothetical protein